MSSMHATKVPSLLNRDQTEEWKGWMQILFLLYHYFEAKELYNAIRIFIAGYVWMTGFGNFSYYYVRADFSLGRFCQALARLRPMPPAPSLAQSWISNDADGERSASGSPRR